MLLAASAKAWIYVMPSTTRRCTSLRFTNQVRRVVNTLSIVVSVPVSSSMSRSMGVSVPGKLARCPESSDHSVRTLEYAPTQSLARLIEVAPLKTTEYDNQIPMSLSEFTLAYPAAEVAPSPVLAKVGNHCCPINIRTFADKLPSRATGCDMLGEHEAMSTWLVGKWSIS